MREKLNFKSEEIKAAYYVGNKNGILNIELELSKKLTEKEKSILIKCIAEAFIEDKQTKEVFNINTVNIKAIN